MQWLFTIGTFVVLLLISFVVRQSVLDALLVQQFSGNISEGLVAQIAEITLIIGTAASALLALVVFLIVRHLRQAQFLAHNMTRELVHSREWFRRLYDYGPTPYLLLTAEGMVFQPNKAALRLFAAEPEQLEGKNVTTIVPRKSRDEIEDVVKRFERGLPTSSKELLIERTDGTVCWTLFSLYPIGVTSDTPSGGLITLVDITEQKRIEKAKTEFVSLASHQLRTPLSAIKWYTGLLRQQVKDRLTEKQKNYLDQTFEANERMIQLVNMLLNVSRIEIGSFLVNPKDISVTDMLEAIVDQMSPQIEEGNLMVKTSFADKYSVYTDPDLLHIVFQNLLSNAIKYTDGGGEITIVARKEGDRVVVSIADTGCGIPKEEQDKIFTKMFRASNARQLSAQGTGLGLYIVKAVVEALQGEISFTSEEGVGTAFTISLPLVLQRASNGGKGLVSFDAFT